MPSKKATWPLSKQVHRLKQRQVLIVTALAALVSVLLRKRLCHTGSIQAATKMSDIHPTVDSVDPETTKDRGDPISSNTSIPPEPMEVRSTGSETSSSTPGNQHKWKKSAAILVFAGVLLGVLSYLLYPSRSQILAPPYTRISLTDSRGTVSSVSYSVQPKGHRVYDLLILIIATPKASIQTSVLFPQGIQAVKCPIHSCDKLGPLAYGWNSDVSTTQSGGVYLPFTIQANQFGYIENGLNALAATPLISYRGRGGSAEIYVNYYFPGVESYDWSNGAQVFRGAVSWFEELAPKTSVPSASETGINYATQQEDQVKTFLVGALAALAGSALLGALQEFLRARYGG
jgi:hypothetical protein